MHGVGLRVVLLWVVPALVVGVVVVAVVPPAADPLASRVAAASALVAGDAELLEVPAVLGVVGA